MEHRIRVNLLGTAIVLSLGAVISLVTSVAVASRAYNKRVEVTAEQQQDLRVKGYARTRVTSDMAVWTIDVAGEAPTLVEAFEKIDASTQHVQRFLDEHGFQPSDVQLSAISTVTHHARDAEGNTLRRVEAYALHRSFTVTTSDVQRVAGAAGQVTQLLREGVHVQSSPPKYTYTKVGDVKIAILGEASADARHRADEIAAKAGCTVSEVRDARMGVMQITRPNSTRVTSYGIYDTDTIEKDISVVVTVTFGIAAK